MGIYSFDVFDTCLTRIYACPADMFYKLAETVLPKLCPFGFGQASVAEFVRLRKLAEGMAREIHRGQREDITLSDIYAQFIKLAPWNARIEDLTIAEMDAERQSIRPVAAMLSLVRKRRGEGHPIVFLSDMYLPSDFIKQCLSDHGFFEQGDDILVSGEIGLSKHSGRLYRYVLDKLGLLPNELFHVGDNRYSDVLVPKRMGIRASLFEATRLNRYEHIHVSSSQTLLSSRLTGLSRLARLNLDDPNNHHALLVNNIIAPLLTAYVGWLIHDANQAGIRKLYFVSRDGQILHKIAQRIIAKWGGPECRYLYGSRQAWFLPSLHQICWDEIYPKFIRGQSTTPSAILRRFQIESTEIDGYLSKVGIDFTRNKPIQISELDKLKNFFAEPIVAELMLEKARQSRETVLGYCTQECLFNGKSWALVDIGWRLQAQNSLRMIVAERDTKIAKDMLGYYLAVAKDRADEPFKSLIDGKDTRYAWIFKKSASALLEQVFLASDHPSVAGFIESEGRYQPEFQAEAKTSLPPGFSVAKQHQDILAYVDIALAEGFSPDQTALLLGQALKSFKMFYRYPNPKEVAWIADFAICHELNHNAQFEQVLASTISLKDVFRLPCLITKHHPAYGTQQVWLEGSAALSAFPIDKALRLLLSFRDIIDYLKFG